MTLLLLLLIVFGLQPCAAALPVLFVRRFVTGSTGEALSAQAATEISQRLEQTYSWHSTGALVADLASNTVDDIVAAWTDCTQGFVLNRQALVNWLNQNQGNRFFRVSKFCVFEISILFRVFFSQNRACWFERNFLRFIISSRTQCNYYYSGGGSIWYNFKYWL